MSDAEKSAAEDERPWTEEDYRLLGETVLQLHALDEEVERLGESYQKVCDDYRKQQVELHKNPDYGVASTHFAPIVSKVCNQYGVEELLDYGAGKGRLAQSLEVDHAMAVQQ